MGGLRRHPAGSAEAGAPSASSLTTASAGETLQPQPPKPERNTPFLPATSTHPLPQARTARNDSLPSASTALRSRARLSNAEAADRSPYVQPIAAKSKRSRRAQRIPSLAAHLLASQTNSSGAKRPSVPSSSAVASSAVAQLPSVNGPSLPPLLRSQTVVSPKHSSRRADASRQPGDESRESELKQAVASSSRGGRRSESLLVGGRLAELGRQSSLPPQQTERVVSEPLDTRHANASHPPQLQPSPAEQRTKAEEEEKTDEGPPAAQLARLVTSSTTSSSRHSATADSVSLLISHHHRLSLGSFASSPLSSVSDHSSFQSTPTASFSARVPSGMSPFHTTSAATTPNKRQTRRQLRGAASSMREAAELAAEGDIDGWVEAEWPLERSTAGEEARRWSEGERLGRVEAAVCDDHNRMHRQAMEDTHTVCLAFNPPDSPPDRPASSFFAVYDGHGGVFASTYAKRHLHRLFAKHMWLQEARVRTASGSDDDGGGSVVRAAFEAAFDELSGLVGRSKRFVSCGTTAVCCYVQQLAHSTVVHCTNIGDASAFLFSSPSDSTRLSTLHTAHSSAECARIEQAGGHILLNRVNGVLAVTRALGDSGMHKAGLIAQPAYTRVELTTGTTEPGSGMNGWWLLLCCDGVSDVLNEAELRALVADTSAGSASASRVASRVIAESLSRGSTDNVTACVVHIHPS